MSDPLNSKIQPYLFFDGRCEEALEFYRGALGAEVTAMMRFKENPEPDPNCQPPDGEKIMHATFRVGNATVMASDGQCSGNADFRGFSLCVTAANLAEAEALYSRLGEGGQVQMPLTRTFFSPGFGMVADRFGVSWMVYVVS